eukprot:TRINITY_DN3650_c1_g1_i1.p1 TRINITY_DN3650_c1_g1~~TRINITY_DN3650_c1_g1_i1.p1  ORF type:complete len:436 (-),score=69.82 TRINITY_DN3650_c1_g1_i1:414-1721(-)
MEKVDQKKRDEYVQSFCDTIRANARLVGKMSGSLGEQKESTKKMLEEAVEALNQDVAKVGVLCGMGSASSWPETKALIDAVQQKVMVLYSALHAMCTGHGASLKAMGNELASDLIDPLQKLLRLAAIEEVQGNELNRLAGIVWHTAKNILKTPLTDRSAISRSMVTKLTGVQDTLREVQKMGRKSQTYRNQSFRNQSLRSQSFRNDSFRIGSFKFQNGGSKEFQQEDEEEEDEDELDDLEEEEIELARMSAKCMERALATMKTIARQLIQGQDNMVNDDNLESWDKVLYMVGDVRRSIEEWGAALYPPQEDENIQKNMAIIYHRMESLQNIAPKIYIDPESVNANYLYTLMEDVRILMEESDGLHEVEQELEQVQEEEHETELENKSEQEQKLETDKKEAEQSKEMKQESEAEQIKQTQKELVQVQEQESGTQEA